MRYPESITIKGIIFDLDGTLYRMTWFFQPFMFFSQMPHPFRLLHFLAERSKLAGKDFGSGEQLLETLCHNLAGRIHTQPAPLREWITHRFYPAFIASMRFQRFGRPQLVRMLAALRERNIRIAVLSDYHAVDERLRMLRIPPEHFDLRTSCEAAGALKPSPRPFTEIALRWKLPAENVLVVGDRDDTDGKAASGAKMHFFRITENKKNENRIKNIYTWPALREKLLTL